MKTKASINSSRKGDEIFSCITDVNHYSIDLRRKIKCSFLERDKMQISSYIKDLEKTATINKQIIESLLEDRLDEEANKKVMLSLNQENTRLQAQLQITTKERNLLQSKLLITEQIVAELKGKEKIHKDQMQAKHQELLDQLNKKEYVLQNSQKKLERVVTVLDKYSSKDEEVKQVLDSTRLERSNTNKITNIVQQNAILATEMESARLKMAELELKLTEVANQENVVQGRQLKENINLSLNVIPKGMPPRPSAELKKFLSENKALKEQVEKLTKENELLKTALNDLQKKNESLSNKISLINEESLNSKANNRYIRNDEREIELNDASFDAISSVKDEVMVEFLSNE